MSKSPSQPRKNLLGLVAFVCAAAALGCVPSASAGQGSISTSAPAHLTAQEIVTRLMQANQRRADHLHGYSGQRVYVVVYHGFPSVKASLTVNARYDAPSDKRFEILSQSGPKLLVDRVLKKLLESEQEAAKDPAATALTPANYTFSLLDDQVIAGRRRYQLHVEPKVDSKFLYRGSIFVDPDDFAVIEIEAEPAKNPSFWIQKTQVHHTYAKTGQFWLPEHNRSESTVRLGGTAVLTIDYGPYTVQDRSAL